MGFERLAPKDCTDCPYVTRETKFGRVSLSALVLKWELTPDGPEREEIRAEIERIDAGDNTPADLSAVDVEAFNREFDLLAVRFGHRVHDFWSHAPR